VGRSFFATAWLAAISNAVSKMQARPAGLALSSVDADRIRDMTQPIALDQTHEILRDTANHAWSFIDKRREQLHE